MVRRSLVVAALTGLCSCSGGRLLISLDRPTPTQLDPMQDQRLAKFSLRVMQGGQVTDQDVFRSSEPELLVGQVPTETTFDLRLAGKSATDDMLGLGLVLDVTPSEGETPVQVYFRKPIGFVAGSGQGLQVLNTAGDEGDVELSSVQLLGQASDLVATPSGFWLLALADQKLYPVRTKEHEVKAPASLDASGRCLAVSPDSRNAVVCHDSGVSVVPLDQIGEDNVRGRLVDLKTQGRAGRVAFAGRRQLWVLLEAALFDAAGKCTGGASTLVRLDIGDGDKVSSPVELGQPVADLVVEPDGTVLLLACDAGQARLGRLDGETVTLGERTPGAQDLVLTDRGVVAVGSRADGGVGVEAKIFDLGKAGIDSARQTRDYSVQPLIVQFTSDATKPGSFAWISEAKDLQIRDVAVAPDGRRAMVTFSANYASDLKFLPSPYTLSCEFVANVRANGYLILDLASGTIPLERYTKLELKAGDCTTNCLTFKDPVTHVVVPCEQGIPNLLKQYKVLLDPEFIPTSTTLLFGGN